MTQALTVDKLEVWGSYKFLRTEDGEWRFWDHALEDHRTMARGDVIVAAGLIMVKKDRCVMEQSYSTTLGVHTGQEHWDELERSLGKRLISSGEDWYGTR